MDKTNKTSRSPRQVEILTAAVKVFFQFGYRKTSMEDVAVEAELSRQTLYLQFRNKEKLFGAALEYMTEQILVSIKNVADSQTTSVETKLLGIFEVFCGDSHGVSSQINIAELASFARSQENNIVLNLETDVLEIIANTLTQAGIAHQWELHDIGSQELARHLIDTSAGIRLTTKNHHDYKQRMALAIKIIVTGASSLKN
ncbi:MAG: TetR/AcrR family transcriptional regulator [OCS116 cluster bacterium]|nr:TetR/AcrR family transcriptional regulator [OCS116 cluster bacterium]